MCVGFFKWGRDSPHGGNKQIKDNIPITSSQRRHLIVTSEHLGKTSTVNVIKLMRLYE